MFNSSEKNTELTDPEYKLGIDITNMINMYNAQFTENSVTTSK